MEETNSGTTVSDRPPSVISLSCQRPRRRAASMPAPMDSGMTMAAVIAASARDLPSACQMNGATGLRYA